MIARVFVAFLIAVAFCGQAAAATYCWNPLAAGRAWGDSVWSVTTCSAVTAGTHAPPTAADTVLFSSTDNSGVAINAAAVALDVSFTNGTGYTGTVSGASTLAVSGSFTNNAATVWTYTGTITLNATATGKTFTSAGASFLGSFTFAGTGGGWTLQDNFTACNTCTLTLTRGALHFNAKTVQIGIINYSGTQTRTFDGNGAIFNLTGFTNTLGTNISIWVGDTPTLLTSDFAGSTITLSGRNALFRGGGLTFNDVTISGGDSASVLGTNTYHNLTYTIANAGGLMNDIMSINNNQTITGTFTVNGGTPQIRARISTAVFNTTVTITAAAVSLANVDWCNVIAAGAAAPFTGASMGDMGGNTNITMSAPRNVFWVGDGGSQSDSSHWALSSGGAGGASMPIPQDTAKIDANSITLAGQTITFDEPRAPAIDFTGVLHNPGWAWQANAIYTGSVTLDAGMSISGTGNFSTFQNISDSINVVLTSHGVVWPGFVQIVNFTAYATADTRLGDDMSANTFQVTKGSFSDAGHNVTAANLNVPGTTQRKITKSGIWTFTLATGTFWSIASATGLTWSDTGSIVLTATAPSGTRTFAGGGQTYGAFTWSDESSTNGLTVTGANTFGAIVVAQSASARTLTLPAATTTTVGSFNTSGTGAGILSIVSSSGGSAATLSDSAGTNTVTNVSIQDSTATGGATFNACSATSVSGNTGWNFNPGSCSGVVPRQMLFGVGALLNRDLGGPANDNRPFGLDIAA